VLDAAGEVCEALQGDTRKQELGTTWHVFVLLP
jgi:hypothetical protein